MRALAAHASFSRIRDAQGPYNGYTPLMDAVWHGHFDAARVLVETGADLSLRGHDGRTALDLAREFGYGRLEELLRQADSREPDR
jgi:ankyrin repeat protein